MIKNSQKKYTYGIFHGIHEDPHVLLVKICFYTYIEIVAYTMAENFTELLKSDSRFTKNLSKSEIESIHFYDLDTLR